MPIVALTTYPGPAAFNTPNMGNILGDAWSYVKKNPLVVVPPLFVAQKTLQAVPGLISTARNEVQATIAPFRPPQQTAVDQLTSALTQGGGTGSSSSSSSILPIALGAGALGLVLILALGRKKKT